MRKRQTPNRLNLVEIYENILNAEESIDELAQCYGIDCVLEAQKRLNELEDFIARLINNHLYLRRQDG